MYEISLQKKSLKVGVALGLSFLSLMQSQAYAHSQVDESLQEQQQLVMDLILAESQQLKAPQARSKTLSVQKSPVFDGPELVLRALYGVGQRLMAEVSFRGESYLYLRGQTWPMGDPQGRSQLRLLEISSRCVRLAHKEHHFDACVSP